MSHYENYYSSQVGGGGIPQIYIGAPYQKGHGIGSFLGGLFRRILPFLTRGARSVGKEALRAGMNVMNDLDNEIPFKNSVKNRFIESGENLKRRAVEKMEHIMNGSGYKHSRKKRMVQSISNRGTLQIASKNTVKKRKKTSSSKIKKRVSVKRKKPTKSNKKKTAKTKARRVKSKSRTINDIFGNK